MKWRIVGLAMLALSASVVTAGAEPIVITGGSISKDSGWGENLSWNDSNIALDGQLAFTPNPFPFQFVQAGDVVSVNATFTGPVEGRGTLNGVPYDGWVTVNGALLPPLAGTASFQLSAAPLTYLPGGEGSSTPFSMIGSLTLGPLGGDPVINSSIVGSGTFVISGGVDSFVFTKVAPTPEPASLLLLATGLLGAIVRRRVAF